MPSTSERGLERQHHGVHIARFRLGVDEVEGNVHHLAVWQLQPGFPRQQLPCLFGQLCLLGVQVAHIVSQRGRDLDALAQPLRRKVQVVGQGKGQVWVQRTVQLVSARSVISAQASTSGRGRSAAMPKYLGFTS